MTFCNLDKLFCEECLEDSDCATDPRNVRLDRLRCDKGLPFAKCVEKDFVENPHDFKLAWKQWDDYIWEQVNIFAGAARLLVLDALESLPKAWN